MYDLHTHSTASDGTLSPTELVRLAHSKGITNLALTDHDLIDGCAEARVEAQKLGLTFINGAEISVSWNHQTIHIVGLNLDITNQSLLDGLNSTCEFRHWRGKEIARRLAKKRIEGAYEGALKYAGGRILARPHFARFLLEQGYAKDMHQVFKRFLTQGKPGYVPGDWASLEDALEWIHGAGGQAVIAHPARYRLSATRLRQFIGEFCELGGIGFEVVSGSHSRDDMLNMAQLASRFELHASAGSDYHGPENPYMDMGRLPPLPDNCLPIWELQAWNSARERQEQAEVSSSSLVTRHSSLVSE